MSWQERTIGVESIREGMFVCRLDRSWEGTPFPLQGFLVNTQEEIQNLRKLCEEVTIDIAQTHEAVRDRALMAPLPRKKQARSGYSDADRALLSRAVRYEDRVDLHEELEAAGDALAVFADFGLALKQSLRVAPVVVVQDDFFRQHLHVAGK